MALPKPSSKSDWTVGNPDFGTVTQEPSSGAKETGWTPNVRPPAEHMNWLFYIADQWIKYFESVVDEGVTGAALQYQAIVGVLEGCTHATLQEALADSDVPVGGKILVVSPLTVATTIQVTKNDIEIEFLPKAILTKGAATTCLQISATGVLIRGARFSGWSSGGNKCVVIDVASTAARLRDLRFETGTTLDVEDNAPASSILGNILE